MVEPGMMMASYSRILLCYDATHQGRGALRAGAELALELRAETHLLAVLDDSGWMQGLDAPAVDMSGIQEHTAREILQQGVADLASRGVFARGHLAIGRPIVQIPLFAEELNVDLVVVGHQKRGRLSRWWSGNPDSLLLDHVHCSVLVVVDDEMRGA
ncbi:universal stress protein [Paraburkholderia terrae]|uniref:universal stress protein n=1 Tax=Paraburkholderia terrae TaxID=311230 RepID=UPI0020BFFBCD|nr:universal stress protein [Paraburkholderia terrae]